MGVRGGAARVKMIRKLIDIGVKLIAFVSDNDILLYVEIL